MMVEKISSKDDSTLKSSKAMSEKQRSYSHVLKQISIKDIMIHYKNYKDLSNQSLVLSNLNSSILDCVNKMKEHKVGHIIVTEKDIHSIVGILSKKDFLLFMIRNFTSDEVSSKLLNHSVFELSIGTSTNGIFFLRPDNTLREV